MLLVVGLGNPGARYAFHRHNIGFMAIDRVAARYGLPPFRSRFQGLATDGRIDGDRVVLLKPTTYMNNAGHSVGAAMRFYKLDPGDVVVLHDELDLRPGKVRVKRGGGHAGHNGLRSVDAHIGPDYRRVRMGVGHPGDKHRVQRHLLSDFAKSARDWLEELLDAVTEAFPLLVAGRDDAFMSKVAAPAPPPDRPAKTAKDKSPPPAVKSSDAAPPPGEGPLSTAWARALSRLRGRAPNS